MSEFRKDESHLEVIARKNEVVALLTDAIIHDFRNLLLILDANADLITRQDLPEEIKSPLHTITEAVRQGKDLADWLLPLSRQSALPREVISLNELVSQAISLVRKALPTTFSFQFHAADLGVGVFAPKADVLHALIGLMLHMKEEMPDGGTLRLQVSKSRATEPASNPTVAISLSAQPALQLDNSHSIEVVEFLARSMNGRLTRIDSSESTTFTLSLPEHRVEPIAHTTAPKAQGAAVVLEPDPMLRAVFCTMLQQLGYAATGLSTITAVRDKLNLSDSTAVLFFQQTRDHSMLGEMMAISSTYPELRLVIAAEEEAEAFTLSHNQCIVRKPFQLRDLELALQA